MRLPLLGIAVLTAQVLSAGGARAAVPVLVVDGRGFGHGVGMAQDGAYWMARNGATTGTILSHFYRGTSLGRAGGEVRVAVFTAPAKAAVVLVFPSGGEVRDARAGQQSAGFPVQVPPGGQVRIRRDGSRYVVDGERARAAGTGTASQGAPLVRTVDTTIVPPPPTVPPAPAPEPPKEAPPGTTDTTAPPRPGPAPPPAPSASSRPLWAVPNGGGVVRLPARERQYRGALQVGGNPLHVVDHVDVEQYLRGMGEVLDPRWPAAALRAQAIAARTYALRATRAGGELCDTQRCQVYLGAQAEYAAMDRAVADTRGQVLMHGGSLASAVYSANGGGVSASPEEGFGSLPGSAYPYLRPGPYLTRDPLPWTVRVALRDVAARLGYRGTLTNVRVGRTGPSGRALDVVLEGSAGPRAVPGLVFDQALGLRSTLFSLRTELAAVAPPPPPPDEGGIQAPPGAPGPAAAVPAAEAAAPGIAPGTAALAAPGPAAAGAPLPLRLVATGLLAVAALVNAAWVIALRLGGTGIARAPREQARRKRAPRRRRRRARSDAGG